VNNTVGPWNGTAGFPLQYINDALEVIAPNGTIFVHKGVYLNTSVSITKSMNFIGENQNITILDGGGVLNSVIVQISGNSLFTISHFTLRNAKEGLQIQNGENATVSHCIFSHCTHTGILMSEYQHLLVTDCTFQDNNRGIQISNCSYNHFYHNNFINNMIQVSSYFNTSYNAWDNGSTGNYWDNYRIKYPNATVIPTTGTWGTPYVVNASGNNTDNHPWVYPNGTIPPGFLQISGPSAGGNGILFNFTVNATDPKEDQIYYKWDWGNGNVSDWLGPFNSSKSVTRSYAWANDGNYSIRVKAKYIVGGESNWSQIHPISIADQVNFSNIKPGTIYIKLLSFNKSFIYSSFLEQFGIIVILSSHELEIKAYATNIVKSVTFKAMNQLAVENMVIIDNNGSDGFSCSMNVSRGVYELTVIAYDINGTLVDTHTLFTVFFIRIGRYATGSSRTLEHILSSHRDRLRN
jgi:parallel beta-helix repeat protein